MAHPLPSVEAVVIGGGPAGAAVARLLARWGHAVQVLTKPERDNRGLAVSIPPSCRKLFDVLEVTADVDAAGFMPTRGNTVWWADGAPRLEAFPDGQVGYQVRERRLSALLLGLAEQAGARVSRDVAVRSVRPGAEAVAPEPHTSAGPVTMDFETAEGRTGTCGARFVFDCSGRAGVIARQGLRAYERRHLTLALVGVWHRAHGWSVEEASHTLVESYESGWAWSVPVSPTVRYFTVMVDPRVSDLSRGGRLGAVYRQQLGRTRHLGPLVVGATLAERPWACDASVYTSRQFGGPGFLLVGDAASCVDPLSSFGVKKALASAWLAAVVAHSCLTRPEIAPAALQLFAEREAQMYAALTRASAEFSRQAAEGHAHRFWQERGLVDPEAGTDGEPDVDRLRRDPEVLAAFEALKRAASIRLRPTTAHRVERRAAVAGHEVVLEDRLMLPDAEARASAVRFLRGVDLPVLTEMAPGYRQVPDLFEAYNRRCPPVILPDFLGVLSVLLARGVLRMSS